MNRTDKRAAKRGEKKQKRGARLKGTPSAINNQGRISRLEGYLGQMGMDFRNVMQNQHWLASKLEEQATVLQLLTQCVTGQNGLAWIEPEMRSALEDYIEDKTKEPDCSTTSPSGSEAQSDSAVSSPIETQ